MRKNLSFLSAFVTLLLLLFTLCLNAYSQEHRTALVIGNGDYKASPLKNPVNDAQDIADALRDLGFSVTLETNANSLVMKEAIKSFGRSLRQGGMGLFYYAGHGMQVKGRNYLIPVGADIGTESEVEYEAIDVGRILGQMEDAGNGLNVIILDACRDNPFARSFRTSEKGLAKMDAPTGSFLAYATAPGSVAADGTGRNGLYTEKLLKHIKTPGLDLEKLFKSVRIDVAMASSKNQIPWESSSLMGEFFFNPTRGITVQGSAPNLAIGKRPVEKSKINNLGMKFVYIAPGTFTIGSPLSERGRYDDERQHQVTIADGFYLQTTEVTQGQWRALMGSNPSHFRNCGDDCPVESVSWNEVQEFISKLNAQGEAGRYRLPTEAEWEYAARAGSKTAFTSGDISEADCGHDANLAAVGWYCGNSDKQAHPVALKRPNAWGLYDMHGNVWEWCREWYGAYPSGAVTNPLEPSSGSHRVGRGGSWGSYAWACRSAFRKRYLPGTRDDGLGFRLAFYPGQ
ncbi:MAG: SUMF1/EgtB/PvdO family nonheme iron enzyme [Thermodesulfobacteriota bacterium]